MRFSDAMRLTMAMFHLSGAHLSRLTGLSQNTISAFQNGGGMSTNNLEKILEVLDDEQREFFFDLMRGNPKSFAA